MVVLFVKISFINTSEVANLTCQNRGPGFLIENERNLVEHDCRGAVRKMGVTIRHHLRQNISPSWNLLYQRFRCFRSTWTFDRRIRTSEGQYWFSYAFAVWVFQKWSKSAYFAENELRLQQVADYWNDNRSVSENIRPQCIITPTSSLKTLRTANNDRHRKVLRELPLRITPDWAYSEPSRLSGMVPVAFLANSMLTWMVPLLYFLISKFGC